MSESFVIIRTTRRDSRLERRRSEDKKEDKKECHTGIGQSGIHGRCTSLSVNGFIKEFGSTVIGFTNLPLSRCRSPSRHTGRSGERPPGALSAVVDPRERQSLLRAHPLATRRRSRL